MIATNCCPQTCDQTACTMSCGGVYFYHRTDSTDANTVDPDSLHLTTQRYDGQQRETSTPSDKDRKVTTNRRPKFDYEQRRTWIRDQGRKPPKIQPRRPERPHRLSMGGANREQ